MSEMPFDENIAESRNVTKLKKDGIYLCVSFVLHTLIMKNGCIDATFLQGFWHNK